VSGWRRDTLVDKLNRCFPELGAAERDAIARDFYGWLGELAAEVIHSGRISRDALAARMKFENPEVVRQALRDGRRVMLLAAHHCNWEWLLLRCSTAFDEPLSAPYKPASWEHADQSLKSMRARFGATMIPADDFVQYLIKERSRAKLLALLADQSPAATHEQQTWLKFFGQDTAFFQGPGWIGAKLGYQAFFIAVRREGRGRYAARFLPLVAAGERADPEQILCAYVKALEAQVRAHPAQYFWAYNRWKRPRSLYD
jgi:KDO2-lipid IV(A) lauroyltransferase